LQFLRRSGLTPGVAVTVSGRDANADSVMLKTGGKGGVTLGTAAASKIWVEGV
jgi:hypothetical protein